MRRFIGVFLFAFCLIFISGKVYTYAFGSDCSGSYAKADPPDPAHTVDPVCLTCGQCGCATGQTCQLDCLTSPINCTWGCVNDPTSCSGACNATTAGKCGISGGCSGVCEVCQGPTYSCSLNETLCGPISMECYNSLHPPDNYICNGQAVDTCSQTNNCPAASCKSTCGSCGCSSGQYCGIYVTQIGGTSVWECVDGSQPGGLCYNSNNVSSGSYPDFSYSGLYFTDLEAVITPIAKILFYAALAIGALMIIYSGYILMTSEGNPQKVQQGQEQLTAAILGIMFVLLSAAILRVIISSIIGA